MEFWRRRKEKGKTRSCFLKNGSIFLQELIVDCNGISNPIKMFSSDQISKSTNYFDPKYSLPESGALWFTWYKGVIEGRSYSIKRITEPLGGERTPYNDIVLSSRVSNHSGFLKLIGCCLENPFPVLVFENSEFRVLNRRGSVGRDDAPLLPWNGRLKIAKEVAIAITYLHTAFSRIIIHRDIKAMNVLLDKNWTAKLSNFTFSVSLPEGKSCIEDAVMGTVGYVDPNYCKTNLVTEYTDVFSFGILMLVLLMGRPPYLDESDGGPVLDWKFLEYVRDLQERGEPFEFGGDSNDMRPGQMKMFLDLALRCCEERNEDRPKMILVAKEIKLIEQVSLHCYKSEILENGQI